MQNSSSVNFPSWVTNSNASNASNKWQEYQIADFLLKNQNLKNQNIYPPTISQLAAHSDYLEKMSNLTAAAVNSSNDMQLNNLNNLNNLNTNAQSHLSDLNGLNDLNSGHLMLSNTANGLQSNHHSLNKNLSNGGLIDGSQLNSFSNHNGSSSTSTSSGSGRKCLNKGNFLCVICNKSFTQKGNLKTHQLIHTGQKPFLCTVCGKGFTQKGNVDTHMKIHTGQKKMKKVKQKDQLSKDRRDDLKFNNQEGLLNMNQNQSVIDRLLPMQLNNSPINFSNHHNSTSTSSASNWNSITNNLINNSGIKSNRSNSSGNNFQSANAYDEFANLANYNSFTQQMNSINNSNHQNLHHKLLEQLNQNGKNSPIQNLTMQQQIDLGHLNYNGNDFSLLQ